MGQDDTDQGLLRSNSTADDAAPAAPATQPPRQDADSSPWRQRSMWLQPLRAALLLRPYLSHELLATPQMFAVQLQRHAGSWGFEAEASYAVVRDAAQRQLGGCGYKWARPNIVVTVFRWYAFVMLAIVLLINFSFDDANARHATESFATKAWRYLMPVTVLLTALAIVWAYALVRMWSYMRVTARHMAATALLREMGARMWHASSTQQGSATSDAAADQQSAQAQCVETHVTVLYLAAVQDLKQRVMQLRVRLLLFLSGAATVPRQTLCASAGVAGSASSAVPPGDGALSGSECGTQHMGLWKRMRYLHDVDRFCSDNAQLVASAFGYGETAARAGAARATACIVPAWSAWGLCEPAFALLRLLEAVEALWWLQLFPWPYIINVMLAAYVLLVLIVPAAMCGRSLGCAAGVASQGRARVRRGDSTDAMVAAGSLAAAAYGCVDVGIPVCMLDNCLRLFAVMREGV